MPGPVEVSQPRMLTRPLVLVFVSSFGFSTSFYLMLSVVPLYATSVGAGGAGAVLLSLWQPLPRGPAPAALGRGYALFTQRRGRSVLRTSPVSGSRKLRQGL